MLAQTDLLTIIFGSLGGIAALVVAVNTVMMRREAKRIKELEDSRGIQMETFKMSQESQQAALARADMENERLRERIIDQEGEIETLRERVSELEKEVGALESEVRRLKRGV